MKLSSTVPTLRNALEGEHNTFKLAQCFYTLSEAIDAAKKAVKEFEYLVIDGPTNDARKFAL